MTLLFLILAFTLQSKTLTGKVVRVSDGDTIVILDENKDQHKIRLDGIDCPEKGQDFGNKATQLTKELCAGKYVTIEVKGKDRYNRVLGVVIVDNKNVNEELLKNGLAWHYKHFNKSKRYATMEQQAKEKKLNIWSMANPIEPWEYRKIKKGSR